MDIKWSGQNNLLDGLTRYQQKCLQAVMWVAQYYAPVIEAYAKENAPWMDRTGNARQTLHAWVEHLARDTVALYLAHGMIYGTHLELARQGKYAIILPALEAHYDKINATLHEIFR